MIVKLPVSTLIPALRAASAVADRKSTMPILANVCLRADAKRLTVIGADLNLTAVTVLPVLGSTPGGLTVGAKALLDIVANLPAGEVSIRKVENNWCEVKGGKVSYRIVGIADRDFPKVPDAREADFFEVDAAALVTMLDRTMISVCHDETRFHLCGVLFESDGSRSRMVSTDGHRLGRADHLGATAKLQMSAGVIIPMKGAREVRKLLDGSKAAKLAVKPPFLFVESDGTTLAVKLIDAQFPPYEQVTPKTCKRTAVIDVEIMKDAVARGALMSSETRGIKLAFTEGTITITSDNPDVGEVTEDVCCEYDDEPMTIGVNPKYLQDALGQMGEGAIAIEMNGVLDQIVVRPAADRDAFLAVLMPMRI